MTTTLDFVALQAASGPSVTLLSNAFVGPLVTGTDYADFSVFPAAIVTAQAHNHEATQANHYLTVTIEHSDDGNSWTTAETLTFSVDGTQSVRISLPKAHLRAKAEGTGSGWQTLVAVSPWYLVDKPTVTVADAGHLLAALVTLGLVTDGT